MNKIDWEEVARRIDARTLPIIYMHDVHRYYIVGDIVVKALDGVSVKIYKGDFTAIMGPSGSGKSTLMNLVGCLDTPTSGKILIDGEDTRGLNETDQAHQNLQNWVILSKAVKFESCIFRVDTCL